MNAYTDRVDVRICMQEFVKGLMERKGAQSSSVYRMKECRSARNARKYGFQACWVDLSS